MSISRENRPFKQAVGWLVILSLLFALVSVAPAKSKGTEAVRLAVITSPVGSGAASEIAKTLVPESLDNLDLVPIHELIPARLAEREVDAGVDAGVSDPFETTAEQALEAALAFKLSEAAQLWREVADTALNSDTVAFQPETVASYLMAAGAASAAAGENDLAVSYFRSALSLDGDIRPGVEISPGAKALFEIALARGPARFIIPRDNILRDICAEIGVDGLVWISVSGDAGMRVVAFKLFLTTGDSSELETRHHPTKSAHAEWIPKERARFSQMVSLKLFGAQQPQPLPEKDKPKYKKPWYKKWWIYAVIGGVVVGGAAAGLAAYFATRPEEADVVVHY